MPGPAVALRVLVTGATSGLGREMAVQLARRGCRLALTGRREERLAAVAAEVRAAGGDPLTLAGSVSDGPGVRRQYAEIKAKWGGLDWAILNAGVGNSKNALEFSAEDYRWTFETNIFGVANWMEAVLPDMLAARSGVIAGIASLAGMRGLPNSGSYCASKAALVTMLESARIDLRGTGVSVVTVCPGFVKSELTDRNDPRKMLFLMETPAGAARILEGIERRRPFVHFPWPLSPFMAWVAPNLPCWLWDLTVSPFAKYRKKPLADGRH